MRVRIDPTADAIYIHLSDREIANSEDLADGIIADYDAEGRIVGLEILDASKKSGAPDLFSQFNLDLPQAAA